MRPARIIDSHHHLWVADKYRENPYLLPEFLNDLRHCPEVKASVFVECLTSYDDTAAIEYGPVGETAFANSAAESCDGEVSVGAAIVGHAELLLGTAVGAVLDAHLAVAPKRLRAIRRMAAWDEDPALQIPQINAFRGLLKEPRLVDGLCELVKRDLHFETWIYHTQLDELTDLANKVPDLSIVLNHCGTPLGGGRYANSSMVLPEWQSAMQRLASCENVLVKIGGLASTRVLRNTQTEAASWNAQTLSAALKPIVLPVIDLFSPERCLFESNFPVDAEFCGYQILLDAYSTALAEFSEKERDVMFQGNAARLYRIEECATTEPVVAY